MTPAPKPETAPETDDDPPRRRFAPVVLAVALACVLVELVLEGADRGLYGTRLWRSLAYQYGAFWPGLLHDWVPNYRLQPVAMFFSYAFLHAGLGHLAGNMVTLLGLGEIAVERVGQRGFLVIYAVSAVGGAALFGGLAPGPQPMVGASGALFGLAGAWQFWLFADAPPGRTRLWRLARSAGWLALLNLVLWWLLDGALAWQTHLGGFIAGWAAAAGLNRVSR